MNSKEAILACEHHVRLTVDKTGNVKQDAYCRFDGVQPVETVFHREWRVVCEACTFGRWCGQDETAANRKARRHKHNCYVVNDAVTSTGGTPRKKLLHMARHTTGHTATLVENELPPY